MDKKFIDLLTRKYPSLTRSQIEQACLLAELRAGTDNERLAYSMVNKACLHRLRQERHLQNRFVSYDCNDYPEDGKGVCETFLAEIECKEEWQEVLKSLPLPCRILARIAQDEAAAFIEANPMRSVWTRQSLEFVRRSIKEKFLAWEWNHSRKAFYKARKRLLAAMHRHERKTRGRRKER